MGVGAASCKVQLYRDNAGEGAWGEAGTGGKGRCERCVSKCGDVTSVEEK